MKKEIELNSIIERKKLLKTNRLLALDVNSNIIRTFEDVQPLYLYPLSILDYIESLTGTSEIYSCISVNIISFDLKTEYKQEFLKLGVKSVEILLTNEFTYYDKLIDLLKFLDKNNILVTLNFKSLEFEMEFLTSVSKYANYFKIFLRPGYQIDKFINKLNIISLNKKEDSVIHIKSYLNSKEVNNYKTYVELFKALNIDVFQLSKELIPLDVASNPLIDKSVIDVIRNIEKENIENPKFISVKNLNTLYYPRFELDERNSRKCYVSSMRQYVSDDYFLPCKVKNVMENKRDWYFKKVGDSCNLEHLKKYGRNCSDCASIFENDILYKLEQFLKEYKGEVKFVLEVTD